MHESALPTSPGDILAGKYRVERVLGRGGMGVVVAARHLELGELFAVKLLLPEAVTDAPSVERFLREARAAVRLKSEHVAKVTDVGRLDSGAPYMVMEHLDGTDLRKHVRRCGPLAVEQAVTCMLQVCEAIAEAHALGIVHRDLKPANLFLTQRPGGSFSVKVLDFGISKQVVPGAVELTRTGEVIGSPLYMAPEQMSRTKEADHRSDIWSLGVVFHELLTGTVPFPGETITEVVASVLQEEPVLPSAQRPGIPPAADAVVARCLQKRPDQRFQSVHELAAALRALQAGAAMPFEVAPPAAQSAPSPSWPGSSPARPPLPSVPSSAHASTASAWGTTGAQPRRTTNGRGAAVVTASVLAGGLLAVAAGYLVFRPAGDGVPTPAAAAVSPPVVVASAEPATATASAAQVAPPAATGTGMPATSYVEPSLASTTTPSAPSPSAPPKPTSTTKAVTTGPAPAVSARPPPSTPTGKSQREGVW